MKHITFLQELIRTPSFSGQEDKTGDLIDAYLQDHGVSTMRYDNNIVAFSRLYDPQKKTILLNSHHDTVKVNKGWQEDPYGAKIKGDMLYGLGSNDAGGPLITLIETFIFAYQMLLPYNFVLAATGEEENFGPKGLSSILSKHLPAFDFGIIGEPTSLEMAVAEKGLMVIDAQVTGVAGHAARNTGINAIYLALEDLQWIANYKFEKVSPHLGPTTMQATQIEAGYQHNVIPDTCKFVIDVRINDYYSNQEIVDLLSRHLKAEIRPRSMRWQSRSTPLDHPVVKSGLDMGLKAVGSPTLSDQQHCNFPTIKIGPGDSRRSHTADEYIRLSELEAAIKTCQNWLTNLPFN